jgi:hypothetical protein
MPRIALILGLVACLSAWCASAAPAAPAGARAAANRTSKVANYSATYPVGDAIWTCTGVHLVGKNFPGDATSGGKDSFTCTITGDTTGYVAGTYTGEPGGFFPPLGPITWLSDFAPLAGEQANRWTLSVTDNGDGTFTVEGSAYYPLQ